MKYLLFSAIMVAGLFLAVTGCHTHDDTQEDGHNHSHEDDAHSLAPDEAEPLSFTLWTQHTELFVEFPPLVVGSESRFAAHFTEMNNYKPIIEGNAKVFLMDGYKEMVADMAEETSSPGIFRLSLAPTKAGIYDLVFSLITSTIRDTFLIENVAVYPDMKEAIAAHPPQSEGDEVSFLKEQAWKVEFGVAQVKKKDISDVIRSSGEILPVKGEEKIISAKSSGIVFFRNKMLQEGKSIRSGESLFTISSKGMVNENLEEKFKVTQARMGKATADFKRAEKLMEQQIIGRKEFENRKMELAIAEAEFKTLSNSYNEAGQKVTSPMSGIVKNLNVSDGQYVEAGTPLIKITNSRRVILKAEVSQKYFSVLPSIRSANFKTSYQEEVQSIDKYNGRLNSYGQMIEQDQKLIPVLFELDNLYNLIPGSFVEMFLMTEPVKSALVIPHSALMQDYGSKYVYVQLGGESFEKREVKLGIDDGVNVQVISGLKDGEWVVTKGAYQLKMASMSSSIPAHGHSH